MTGSRILGGMCGAVLLGALGSVTACGSPEGETAGSSAQAVTAANVAITLHDASGARVGEGSGVLIAPRLVLTSAHLVAGQARWTVRTVSGKTASAARGLTYDWMPYNSDKAHPRKN